MMWTRGMSCYLAAQLRGSPRGKCACLVRGGAVILTDNIFRMTLEHGTFLGAIGNEYVVYPKRDSIQTRTFVLFRGRRRSVIYSRAFDKTGGELHELSCASDDHKFINVDFHPETLPLIKKRTGRPKLDAQIERLCQRYNAWPRPEN